jgi:hypothetical protein
VVTGLRKGRGLAILWADVPADRRADLEVWASSEPLAPTDPAAGVLAIGRYAAVAGYEFAHPEVSRQPAWDRARARSVWRRRIERFWAHAAGSPGIYRRLAAH